MGEMEDYYLIVNGRRVGVGDVVELQFLVSENVFSRDDRGVVILLDRTYPINVALKRSGRRAVIMQAKIVRFIPRQNNRFCAIAAPVT
ncbi:MAG: hypothetical protein QXZ11_03305 [Thermoproteota archaeon]